MTESPPPAFEVRVDEEGEGMRFEVRLSGSADSRIYRLDGGDHQAFIDFFTALAGDFGTRLPHVHEGPQASEGPVPDWRPLIVDNLSPRTHAGYGDPAALKTEDGKRVAAIEAEYVGFLCPDYFVVGYGMDVAHAFRELPYVARVMD